MFTVPIIRNKLIVPQNPEYFVGSPRIKELSERIFNSRVTTITAPAGYGKTSLAVAALKSCAGSGPIRWCRLEQEDSDPASFYSYLIELLFPDNIARFRKYRGGFDAFGDIPSQYRTINAAICDSLYACYGKLREKVCLVLDDFHNICENEFIVSTIRFFIDNLPNNFLIILISRIDNGILTEKQKLENIVFEINYPDLSLTGQEIEYLAEKFGGGADKSSHVLAAEGWAAGVIMACQSHHSSMSGKNTDRIRQFNYFTLEVLKSLEPEFIQSLVKLAVLEDFTAESAEQILDISNFSAVTDKCENKGLFLQKYIGDTTTYRFHGLFRSVLLQLQAEQLTRDQIVNYHVEAANYYRGKGIYNKAIEHYIAGEDTGSAIGMIMEASRDLSSLQSMDKLKLLFNAAGSEILENNPHLMYMKSFLYQNGEEAGRLLLNKSFDILMKTGDHGMAVNVLFSLIAFYLFKNDLKGLKITVEQALKIVRIDGNTPSDLTEIICFVSAVWEGRTNEAAELCRKIDIHTVAPSFAWTVLMYSCIHYIVLGKQDLAESTLKEILSMDMVMHTDMLRSFAMLFSTINAFLKNNVETFQESKKQLMVIAEKYNVLYLFAFSKVFSAMELYRKQDVHPACTAIKEGVDKFEQLGNRGMYAVFSLMLLLYQSDETDKKETFMQARDRMRILEEEPAGFFITEMGMQLLGTIAVETEHYPDAWRYLKTAEEICTEKKEAGLLCETQISMAVLCLNNGDDAKAQQYLQQAFFIASSRNQVVFPCVTNSALVRMAALAVRSGIYREYAFHLIESNFGKERLDYFRKNVIAENNVEKLCQGFFDLNANKSEKDRAVVNVTFLDKFSINSVDVSISANNFKTKKDAGIIKYLLFYKNKPVSREFLTEMFWPESDKKSGSASMRSALYAIRKLLAESGISAGNEPLIRENNGFLEISRPGIVLTDVEQFIALDHELHSAVTDSKNEEIVIASLEKMTHIYQENLLEDGVYDDWAYYEREKLKSIYLRAVLLLVNFYDKHSETQKSEAVLLKALSLDSYNENLCFELIKIFTRTKQFERAVKFYGDFKKTLMQDLNVEPDEKFNDLLGEYQQSVPAG